MTTVVIRHKVGNINKWLKGHEDRVEIFSKFASGFQTLQDTNDPASVVLIAEVFDMDAMQAVLSNPDIIQKIAKEKHTVLEPITVSIPVAVAETV